MATSGVEQRVRETNKKRMQKGTSALKICSIKCQRWMERKERDERGDSSSACHVNIR